MTLFVLDDEYNTTIQIIGVLKIISLLVTLKMTYTLCTKESNDNMGHLTFDCLKVYYGWTTNHLVCPDLPLGGIISWKGKGLCSLLNSPCKVIELCFIIHYVKDS